MLGLTETKLKDLDVFRAQSLWGNTPCKFVCNGANENASGGVLMIWNPSAFICSSSYLGERWILLNGTIVKNQWNCLIVLIYGGNTIELRTQQYEDILRTRGESTLPLLIMGDFNEVLHISERKGQARESSGMRKFQEWCNRMNLIDIPLGGRRYTWKRGGSKSKLDRFLCTSEWMVTFPSIQASWQAHTLYNHIPLFLSLYGSNSWGEKPFRCLDIWFKSRSFQKLINEEWNKLSRVLVHKN